MFLSIYINIVDCMFFTDYIDNIDHIFKDIISIIYIQMFI